MKFFFYHVESTPEELNRMPQLYETEGIRRKDKIIHQHYFVGGRNVYKYLFSLCTIDDWKMENKIILPKRITNTIGYNAWEALS